MRIESLIAALGAVALALALVSIFGGCGPPAELTEDADVVRVLHCAPISLDVELTGATDVEHVVALRVDGLELAHLAWSGETTKRWTVPVPPAYLVAQEHTARLVVLGGAPDRSLVDAFTWQCAGAVQ